MKVYICWRAGDCLGKLRVHLYSRPHQPPQRRDNISIATQLRSLEQGCSNDTTCYCEIPVNSSATNKRSEDLALWTYRTVSHCTVSKWFLARYNSDVMSTSLQRNERTLTRAAFVVGLGVWDLHILWQYIYFGVFFFIYVLSKLQAPLHFWGKFFFSTTQPVLTERWLINQGRIDV